MKYLFIVAILFFQAEQIFSQDYSEIHSLLFKKKKYSEANTLIDNKLRYQPDDDSALFYKGVILFYQKKFEDAVTFFEKCVNANKKCAQYHLWLGKALGQSAKRGGIFAQIGSVGRIKGSFEKAIELDPKSFEARYMLVAFHLQAPGIAGGSQDVAVQQAVDYEKINEIDAKILWASIYAVKKENNKFLDIFFSMSPPKDSDVFELYRDTFLYNVYVLIGDYLENGNSEKAKELSLRCIAMFPESSFGYWGYGRYLTNSGNYDEAVLNFEKAISLDSKSAGNYYRIGIAYQLKGEKEKAISAFEKYLSFPNLKEEIARDARDRLNKLK